MTAGDRVQPVLDAAAAITERPPGACGSTSSATARRTSGSTTRSARTSSAPSGPPYRWPSASCWSRSVRSWPPSSPSGSRSRRSSPPTALLAVVSHRMHVDTSTSSVMLLVGLAVGVDYCMFYLRREREERVLGRDPDAALAHRGGHVRAVGAGVRHDRGRRDVGHVPVRDAALRRLRHRGDPRRPGRGPRVGDRPAGPAVAAWRPGRLRPHPGPGQDAAPGRRQPVWGVVLDRVLSGPRVSACAAVAFLLVLAAPAITIHTEKLSLDKLLPADASIMQTYQHITAGVPRRAQPRPTWWSQRT